MAERRSKTSKREKNPDAAPATAGTPSPATTMTMTTVTSSSSVVAVPKFYYLTGYELMIAVSYLLVVAGSYCILLPTGLIPTGSDDERQSGHPIFALAGVVCLAFGAVTAYVLHRTTQPPEKDLAYLARRINASAASENSAVGGGDRPPVLVCLGDSITHGRCSANYVDMIPDAVDAAVAAKDKSSDESSDHVELEVINMGQNNICTHTVLHERLPYLIACKPDFVLVLLGTNDVKGTYKPRDWGRASSQIWSLPKGEELSLDVYEKNLNEIVDQLARGLDSESKIGVCTLPPMGEDLKCDANNMVRNANKIVRKVVGGQSKSKVNVVDVYGAMEREIKKSEGERSSYHPVDDFFATATWMGYHHHALGRSWVSLSAEIGNTVLSDSLHLNEVGATIVADVVADWLVKRCGLLGAGAGAAAADRKKDE